MSEWNPGDTAPRTGQLFLADVGLPWLVMAMWSEAQDEFCYASPVSHAMPMCCLSWLTPKSPAAGRRSGGLWS